MGRKSLGEVQARRTDVYQMMMEGKSKSFIVSYCATNWGVRLSAVEKDMIALKQEMLVEYQKEKQEIVVLHAQRYENLYRFYMDEGIAPDDLNIYYNPETAAKMLEKKEKLLHLHNPDVVVNTQNVENQQNINVDFSNLSVEEIKNLLNKE